MRVIIAGSRKLRSFNTMLWAIRNSGFNITEVVSGKQITYENGQPVGGADYLGEKWARMHEIPVTPFWADWTHWGKAAGPRRNSEMVKYAREDPEGGALIAVRVGEVSKGTDDVIAKAQVAGLKVFVAQIAEREGDA